MHTILLFKKKLLINFIASFLGVKFCKHLGFFLSEHSFLAGTFQMKNSARKRGPWWPSGLIRAIRT
jgi:hypothetical protein